MALAPNELGDFLAGTFGPLAILWVILGFWQQGDELKSSVEALRLQSDELRNSVEQQRKLVEINQLKQAQDEAILHSNSQPNLHLTVHGQVNEKNPRNPFIRLKLANFGAPCSQVIIINDTHDKIINQIGFMGKDEDLEFTFFIAEFIDLDFILSIKFVGLNNIESHQRFSLKRSGSSFSSTKIE